MVKIKTVVTALSNPNLYYKLKETKKYNLPSRDFLNKDELFEYLKINSKNIDILIVGEEVLSEDNKETIIFDIKKFNHNIKIVIILNNYDFKFENFLKNEGIFNVFFSQEVSIDDIYKCLDEELEKKYQNIPRELIEEIDYLKNAINSKTKKKEKVMILFNKIKKCFFLSKIKNKKLNNSSNIISIFGSSRCWKKYFFCKAGKFHRKRI